MSTSSPLTPGNFSLNRMPRWPRVPEDPSALLNSLMHLFQNFYDLGMISLFFFFSPSDRIEIKLEMTALLRPIIPEATQGQNRRLTVICCQNQNYKEVLVKVNWKNRNSTPSSHLYPIFSISQQLPISYWISHKHIGCWTLFLQGSTTLLGVKLCKHE